MRLKPRINMQPPEEQQCLLRNNQIVNRHYDDNVSWTTNARPVALTNSATRVSPQLWREEQILERELLFTACQDKNPRSGERDSNRNKTPGRDSALASPEFGDVASLPDGNAEDARSPWDLEYDDESSPLLGHRHSRASPDGGRCSSDDEERGCQIDNYRSEAPGEEDCRDEESEDSLFSDSSYDMSDSKDLNQPSPVENHVNANNKITTVLTNRNSLNRNLFRGTSRVDQIFTETVQPFFSVSSRAAGPPRISPRTGTRPGSSSPPIVLDKLKLTLEAAADKGPAPESPMSDSGSSSASSELDVNVSAVSALNNKFVSMASSKENELLRFLRAEEDSQANIVFADDSKILNTQEPRQTLPEIAGNPIEDLFPKCQDGLNNAGVDGETKGDRSRDENAEGELNDNFLIADAENVQSEQQEEAVSDGHKYDASDEQLMDEIRHFEAEQWVEPKAESPLSNDSIGDENAQTEATVCLNDQVVTPRNSERETSAVDERLIPPADKPKESRVEKHSVGVSTMAPEVSVPISANKETSDVALSPVEALNREFDDDIMSSRYSARRRPPKNSSGGHGRFGRKPLNGDFDVYNIETAMPTIDWAAMEEHLTRAAKENDWLRRNDREEIRRKLAMDSDNEDYYCGERVTRKPSLTTRLQSGMNLQICFMNETASDLDSQGSDQDSENGNSTPNPGSFSDKRISNVLDPQKSYLTDYKRQSGQTVPNYTTKTNQQDQKTCNSFFGQEPSTKEPEQIAKRQRPSFFFSRQKSWRLGQLKASQKKEDPPNNKTEKREEDFLTRHARLQAEARHALSQAKEMARMQMEIERQRKKTSKKSPIADIVGISFPDGRHRLSRQLLTDMNVAQLQVIVNDLHSQIESLNEDLVRLLLERDDLNMQQDSVLVDIEDMTRFLGAKEEALKTRLVPPKMGMK